MTPFIIGIVGSSGSGKTELTKRLVQQYAGTSAFSVSVIVSPLRGNLSNLRKPWMAFESGKDAYSVFDKFPRSGETMTEAAFSIDSYYKNRSDWLGNWDDPNAYVMASWHIFNEKQKTGWCFEQSC